jgi:glucose-6-phosphate-specific signal transduction histidine kinase
MMDLNEYKRALKIAQTDLETMRHREVELNDELLELRTAIAELAATERGLARICREPSISERAKVPESLAEMISLSNAIRALLKSLYPEALTALELRNRLASVGFDSKKRFKNLTAAVHTNCKRLVRTKELLKSSKDEKAAYQWNPNFKK